MNDPAKFATLTEYQILMWSVGLLILSECMIMFLTSFGNKGSRSKNDRGTIWLIMFAWCCNCCIDIKKSVYLLSADNKESAFSNNRTVSRSKKSGIFWELFPFCYSVSYAME